MQYYSTYVMSCLQAMDLSQHQMDWVTEHLGHSIQIHKLYYRQTSSVIERAQVAKLLLLQDSGATDQLKDKKLEDIRFSGRMGLQVSVLLWAATHTIRDVCVNVGCNSYYPSKIAQIHLCYCGLQHTHSEMSVSMWFATRKYPDMAHSMLTRQSILP